MATKEEQAAAAELRGIAVGMEKVVDLFQDMMKRGTMPSWADVEEVKTALVKCIEPNRGCFMWVESTGEELDPYPGSKVSKLAHAMIASKRNAEKAGA